MRSVEQATYAISKLPPSWNGPINVTSGLALHDDLHGHERRRHDPVHGELCGTTIFRGRSNFVQRLFWGPGKPPIKECNRFQKLPTKLHPRQAPLQVLLLLKYCLLKNKVNIVWLFAFLLKCEKNAYLLKVVFCVNILKLKFQTRSAAFIF